jgi:hypothetical protein
VNASIGANAVAPFGAGSWSGIAYVMVAPSGVSSKAVQPVLDQTYFDAGPAVTYGEALPPRSGAWTQIYVNASLDAGKQLTFLVVGTYPDAGAGCFLVDDVSLVKQ